MTLWLVLMFLCLLALLLLGYPVAFVLGGVSLFFGILFLDVHFFLLLPLRIWGIMTNFNLLAVPLFVLMGAILDKGGIAEELLETMARLFGRAPGGLAFSVIVVGALLSATTGVVGATVVTMGIFALPTMLKHHYAPAFASGTIAAAGTLGQIVPPSLVIILLSDMVGIPTGRAFIAALIPALLLVVLFLVYAVTYATIKPHEAPAILQDSSVSIAEVVRSIFSPLILIFLVLGSIFFGVSSPTESAALGAAGAIALTAARKKLTKPALQEAVRLTTKLTSMVFFILIGATAFSLVFRGMGGGELVGQLVDVLPGGKIGFLICSMGIIFILGFFIDFLQICFIVVPILAPLCKAFEIDLLWFILLVAINLQTSFLTPPFGFSLFYLKAVSPPGFRIQELYRGIIPYVVLQVIVLAILLCFPSLVTWLPDWMDRLLAS